MTPVTTDIDCPAPGAVRVSVVASGVCHADIATSRAGHGSRFPVTPGHEIAGTVAEVGPGVSGWRVGDRVAIGWFGGSCGHCAFCRRGDVVHCTERLIPGISYPGGWAQSILVPADALARIPDELGFFEAAPMGCAGVTVFNALRGAGVEPGGRVAVLGLGGLGHLGVQFAAKMGYEVVSIARGLERAVLARDLGAAGYLDSTARDPGKALRDTGGADLILSTVPSSAAVQTVLGGLRPHGRLTLVGVDAGSVALPVAQLVMNGQTVSGHLTGSALDTEEAMRFAALTGVRPRIERMALSSANEAVDRLVAGRARFRIVLDAGRVR